MPHVLQSMSGKVRETVIAKCVWCAKCHRVLLKSCQILQNVIVITKSDVIDGMLRLLPYLWNKEKLFFSIFSGSLLSENDSLILINSSLTVFSNMFKLLRSKGKLVLSSHIIGAHLQY